MKIESVNKVRTDRDGSSNTLVASVIEPFFKEHLGTSRINDICSFYNTELRDELSFIESGLVEERNYVIIEDKSNDISLHKVDNFNKDYLEIYSDITGVEFSDEDIEKINMGDESKYTGSWHILVKFYNINGINIISSSFLDGISSFYILKDELEDIIDMTNQCNYYRFVDKELQILRMNGRDIDYQTINSIFTDITDNYDIEFKDFSQISESEIMVKFNKQDANFDQEFIDDISKNITRFNNVYKSKFIKMDVTRNHMMYINDPNKTWSMDKRPVYSFNLDEIDKLLSYEADTEILLPAGYISFITSPHTIYLIYELV